MEVCQCGRIAVGRCARCQALLCKDYWLHNPPDRQLRLLGPKTLDDAAYAVGFARVVGDNASIVICNTCRDADGRQRITRMRRESRAWPRDTFQRAIYAIFNGYAYQDLNDMPLETIIRGWMALQMPTQTFDLPIDTTQRRRRRQPSKANGWEIPAVTMVSEGDYYSRTGSAYITASGQLLDETNISHRYLLEGMVILVAAKAGRTWWPPRHL